LRHNHRRRELFIPVVRASGRSGMDEASSAAIGRKPRGSADATGEVRYDGPGFVGDIMS